MPKISVKRSIVRRVADLKKTVRLDTQRIRGKTIEKLERLFDLAVKLARGEVKTQTQDGKKVVVTLKQRQMWARVAAYIAQIMNSIAKGFDEREIDVQLDELERLVNEARAKEEAKKTKGSDAKRRREKVPKNPVKFFKEVLRIKPYSYQAKFLREALEAGKFYFS